LIKIERLKNQGVPYYLSCTIADKSAAATNPICINIIPTIPIPEKFQPFMPLVHL